MLHRCFLPQNHTFLPKGYVHFLSNIKIRRINVYFSIRFFRKKSDDYFYLYIKNTKAFKTGTQNPVVFVWAGREY